MKERPLVPVAAPRWLIVHGLGHFFLNDPTPKPICGLEAPDSSYPAREAGEPNCLQCDDYFHERWLVQVG